MTIKKEPKRKSPLHIICSVAVIVCFCLGGWYAMKGAHGSARLTGRNSTIAKLTANGTDFSKVGINNIRAQGLIRDCARVIKLHQSKKMSLPGDWLAEHKEAGQTFKQYLFSRPVVPSGKRKILYIQPIGVFSKSQEKIITLAAEFMGIYLGLETIICDKLPLGVVDKSAQRTHPSWGGHQLLSTYILNKVLKPRLPEKAAAYIAFTSNDLWPGKGWNFVFGQASLRGRVGVWSLYRNGKPDKSDDDFKKCLLRTIKIATHETGHMFSMKHCIAYECNLCGCNNQGEADRLPLWLGPECLAKICWASRIDPAKRYEKLAGFCQKTGLENERQFYIKSMTVFRDVGESVTAK